MDYCSNCGASLNPASRFCASCGVPADSEQTKLASEETRFASEETRVAAPRPQMVSPSQPVRQQQPVNSQQQPLAERGGGRDEVEQVVFNVRPTLLFIKIGYVLAALGGLAVVALLALLRSRIDVPLYVSIPLALALLLIPAYYHVKRNMIRYTLTDSKIEIDQGFISRTTRNVPLRNIQDVTVTSTVFQRLLKFGNVVVDNASESGGNTVLRNIPDPRRHADLLLRELRRWH
ncbi:MAG: PH domain-containing protein [Acidobacteria bacterium]|nr:PH domain-containing protein [Acidobacteriota bacterium]